MVLRCYGFALSWFCPVMVLPCHGFALPWFCPAMVLPSHGFALPVARIGKMMDWQDDGLAR
jgi:hypothetical protein